MSQASAIAYITLLHGQFPTLPVLQMLPVIRSIPRMKSEDSLTLLTTINDKNIFTYQHFPGETISGCYAVSAFDLNGNESEKSVMICIDSCNFYEIPNVFTPNGDNIND